MARHFHPGKNVCSRDTPPGRLLRPALKKYRNRPITTKEDTHLHLTRQIHAVVLLLPLLSGSSAAAPAIGVATASGKFTLDRANHRSNATLFEGNTFDSGTSELEFRLASGTTVQLGAAARGAIFHDHILLRDGGGDVRPGTAYT